MVLRLTSSSAVTTAMIIFWSKYGFCLSPKVTYLHTKNEEGLKIFISNFASLSWRIALKRIMDRTQWTHSTNKIKTSPVLCSCAASKHTQKIHEGLSIWTHMHVRESFRLLFISIPVPSWSFVKASQNPKPKFLGVYTWKLLVWRKSLFILTHWCLKEIACDPPLIPWRFMEYYQASESTKINICVITTDTKSGFKMLFI